MKRIPFILLGAWAVACLAVEARAAVVDFAAYHLGEPGSVGTNNRPIDAVSGNNYQGNLGSAVVTGDVSPIAAATTGSTHSLQFADNGYYNTAIAFPEDNFGMEIWVKSNGTENGAFIWGNGSEGAVKQGIGFVVNGGKYSGVMPNVAWVQGPTAPMANDGEWHHLAIVRDSSHAAPVRFYVDGGLVATHTATPVSTSGAANSHLGVNSGGGIRFDGWLDEGRVFTFASGQFSTSDLTYNSLNLVKNPSFEDGLQLYLWNASGSVDVAGTQGQSHGTVAAHFNGGDSATDGVVWQTLDTIAGQSYEVSFDFGKFGPGGGTAALQLEMFNGTGFGGTPLLDEIVSDTSGVSANNTSVFDHFAYTFIAQGNNTTFRFTDASSGTVSFDAMLDNVVITASPVPEPNTGLLIVMAGGMSAVGLARSRRRSN